MRPWLPLLAVSIVVVLARFRIGEALSRVGAALILLAIEAHGTRKLVNGQDARARYAPAVNRKARRSRRHLVK